MKSRLLTAVVAWAALACCAAAAATAATGGIHVTEARASFPERAFVLGLPKGMRLGPNQVQVVENGKPVSDLSVDASGSGSTTQFGVLLLIDASQSMRGRAIAGAMAAARTFADRRPASQELGVIAFNGNTRVVVPLTTDGGAIHDALLRAPKISYGTRLYDAVGLAVDEFAKAKIKAGSIIVLSDGADTASRTSEKEAAQAAREGHIRVFTVGLESRSFDQRSLKRLAADASGHFSLAGSPQELRPIYAALGAKFAREYLLSYRSRRGPGERVAVSVKVAGVPGVAVSGYHTPSLPVDTRNGAKPYSESVWHKLWTSPLTMILVAFIAASLVAFAVMIIVASRRGGTLPKRMAEFVSIPMPEEERSATLLTDRVEAGTEQLLGRTRWWGRFVGELELAGISWSPRRVVLFTFIGTFIAVWFLSLVTGSKLVALIGFAIPFMVRSVIRRKVEKKRRQFADQLPDNLQVLSSALRAGHSFIGALSVVVEDAPEPSRTEFRRVIADEQLGVPLEDALHVVVERMESRELEQVALVAAVQRNSGGNTAEVLDRVTETIRERFELRRLVRTLTAQGRLSRWVVSLLPVLLLTVITLINPSYMHILYSSPAGRIAIVFAALMVLAGSWVIKRIVNIRV
jgi:tight adherence protein B